MATPDVAGSLGRQAPGPLGDGDSDGWGGLTVRFESPGRLDVLARRLGGRPPHLEVPEELSGWVASQFETHLDDPEVCLIVLSLSAELTTPAWRHTATGVLWPAPPETGSWEARRWLEDSCREEGPPSLEATEAALREIVGAAGSRGVMVYNVSTYDPVAPEWGQRPGVETISERANRLDILLDRLAGELDLTVVDVDRIVAEVGAGEGVVGAGVYSPPAGAAIAQEAFEAMRYMPAVAARFAGEVLRLAVPGYDRRTVWGEILTWHVTAPVALAKGQKLFDLRFGNLHHRLGAPRGPGGSHRALTVSVVAAGDGYLHEITAPAGTAVEVGSTAGVVTRSPEVPPGPVGAAAGFPVGVAVLTR